MFGKRRRKDDKREIIQTFDPVIQSKLAEMDAYNKKMASLVQRPLDYVFLEQLINQVETNKVEIIVTLNDGTKLEIRQEKEEDIYRRDDIE